MSTSEQLQRDIQFLESTIASALYPRDTSAADKEKYKGLILDDLQNKQAQLAHFQQKEEVRDRQTQLDGMHVTDVKGRVKYAIMSVRGDEYQAVLRRFPMRTRVNGGKTIYDFSEVDTKAGKVGVAFCRTPLQGTKKAQSVASHLIDELNPEWIFVVGIAGGFPYHEYCLGDVIVADRLHDFSVSAAYEGGGRGQDPRGGPMHRDVEKVLGYLPGMSKPDLLNWHTKKQLTVSKPSEVPPDDLDNDLYYGSPQWRESVKKCVQKGHPAGVSRIRTPKFVVGNTASSDTLVMDTNLAKQWQDTAKNVCAIEMELAGVFEAVHDSGLNQKLVSIRGLSDIVGYKRKEEWTEYACHTSASFVTALILSGICEY